MKQQLSLSAVRSVFSVCLPTLFELVCLINSEIYKGLTLPQEITLSLSLSLRTAARAASKRQIDAPALEPIVWPITHSCALPP